LPSLPNVAKNPTFLFSPHLLATAGCCYGNQHSCERASEERPSWLSHRNWSPGSWHWFCVSGQTLSKIWKSMGVVPGLLELVSSHRHTSKHLFVLDSQSIISKPRASSQSGNLLEMPNFRQIYLLRNRGGIRPSLVITSPLSDMDTG
jgi:hypothetical protein